MVEKNISLTHKIYSDVASNESAPGVTDQNWIQYLLYLNQLWYIFIWKSNLVEQVHLYVLLECAVNQSLRSLMVVIIKRSNENDFCKSHFFIHLHHRKTVCTFRL